MENSSLQYGQAKGVWEKARNIFRISYTLVFVFAALAGVAFAWTEVQEWTIGVLIIVDVFFLALFVNISNDYFDHKSGADKNRWTKYDAKLEKELKEMFNEKFYWSGNAFDRGIVTDRTGQIIIATLGVIAVLIAIPIVIYGGWIVVLMGGIAFFLSYYYTAPPLNLGARGFGELDVFLSFTFLALFPYIVLVGDVSLEAVVLAVTVGIVVMLLRVVDQMFGYEAHKEAGEKDFSVRFGLEGASKVVLYCLTVMYALDLALVLFFGVGYAILFLTIPLAIGMSKIFANREDRFRWLRPIPLMLKTAMGQMLLLTFSQLLMSWINELSWHPL
ncbi:MAG: prenyltransferase [Methanomassiliicoccales archaeon]|nr:MAG: prenyltransferase [Methanomassiliicoccales archaeon]